MSAPTPTETPQEYANASAGFASSMGLAEGFAPLALLLIYAIGALMAAQFVAPWLASSQLLSDLFGELVTSVELAIKGLGATAVLAITATPIYFVATAEPSTKVVALEVVAAGIGVYVFLVVAGWLADRAVTAFIDAHPTHDEWADIFPDEEGDGEAVTDGGEA